jgi:hypothetical protein
MGTVEAEVVKYFRGRILPEEEHSRTLKRSEQQPMAKHTVPTTASDLKVSTPVPDMLYGYDMHVALPQQQPLFISMGPEMVAFNQFQSLIYPFLVVEFKGDGGSMWAATNQCLGGTASCVNIAERLNDRLRKCGSNEGQRIDSVAFSIAMNGTEARVHITWKHDELKYYMLRVQSYLLQDAHQYIEFRKIVRNIIDWAQEKRLNEIRASLDKLLEESRTRSSKAARSRQPESDGTATSGKRCKSLSIE